MNRWERAQRAIMLGSVDPSRDIDHERQRQALVTTAQFVDEHMAHLSGFRGDHELAAKLDLLRWAVGQAPLGGLALELGVATGSTLREIAAIRPVHGFDSFEGLPEDWRSGYGEGAFAQEVPQVPNAEMHVGWFDASLPGFLEAHEGPFDFVHMDCDLYSSTKTVFDLARDRFVPGTVILFDEYFNYPGWQQHEHKAFTEFIEATGLGFAYIGYNAMHEQVAVRLS